MDMDLFVYGPLANRDILFLVTRIRPHTDEAELPGFEEVKTPRGFRTIRKRPGTRVRGLLIRQPCEKLEKRIARYLGPNYKLVNIHESGRDMRTFVLRDRLQLDEGIIDTPWLSRVLRSVQSRRQIL